MLTPFRRKNRVAANTEACLTPPLTEKGVEVTSYTIVASNLSGKAVITFNSFGGQPIFSRRLKARYLWSDQ